MASNLPWPWLVILLQGSSCRHYRIGKYNKDEGDCGFRGLQNDLGFCFTVRFLNRVPAILLTLLSSLWSPSLLPGASSNATKPVPS